ncbi:MAG: response regulator transcription factor [Acidobacteria bacterium]|nr:response regulator transcription factor [Acidobacteriota bacterium]MDW7985353.1 response regulator transcription factor [Acidobacteriota bacterium]
MRQASVRHVLLVEDDPDLRRLLALQLAGWGYRVTALEDAEKAWTFLNQRPLPDVHLAIIDVLLPGLWDGLDLVREIRRHPQWSHLPILVLTARGAERDVVRGLGSGADDYVVKPYRPAELQARLAALLRRAQPVPPEVAVPGGLRRWGPLMWRPQDRVVTQGDQTVPLTATEYRIFELLAEGRGRVFTREEILDALGETREAQPRTVDVHIWNIRRKLGPCGRWLVAVRGMGYAWRPEPLSEGD